MLGSWLYGDAAACSIDAGPALYNMTAKMSVADIDCDSPARLH